MTSYQHHLLPKQPNRSLIDGMRVLQCVMNDPKPARVIDVAETLDIEQTRAHRLLRTLTGLGYLRQVEGRRYTGGPAVPILASQAMLASGFVHTVFPILQAFVKRSGMLVAYGLFWERTVTYLFHARPTTRAERAIAGHDVLPATHSRIGLAVLAQMKEADVAALYNGHDTAPFDSLESLMETLRLHRADGFAFGRGFAKERGAPSDESSLALTVPNNPHAGVAMAGNISRADLPRCLDELREVVARVSRSA